jgi:hypothetical protein
MQLPGAILGYGSRKVLYLNLDYALGYSFLLLLYIWYGTRDGIAATEDTCI